MGAVAAIITAASSIGSAVSQFSQGGQAKSRADYVAGIHDQNAGFADLQAEDAIARGYEAEFRKRLETKQTRGAQRAALAAQGINVDSGSAAEAQLDTEMFGEADAVTIRNNAKLEAWGYRTDAHNLRQQGHLARVEGRVNSWNARIAAGNTLLTGGAQTYSAGRNR